MRGVQTSPVGEKKEKRNIMQLALQNCLWEEEKEERIKQHIN